MDSVRFHARLTDCRRRVWGKARAQWVNSRATKNVGRAVRRGRSPQCLVAGRECRAPIRAVRAADQEAFRFQRLDDRLAWTVDSAWRRARNGQYERGCL